MPHGQAGCGLNPNSGQPVDHSGPGLSRAYNSSNTRSNAEGLPTNFSLPSSRTFTGGCATCVVPFIS